MWKVDVSLDLNHLYLVKWSRLDFITWGAKQTAKNTTISLALKDYNWGLCFQPDLTWVTCVCVWNWITLIKHFYTGKVQLYLKHFGKSKGWGWPWPWINVFFSYTFYSSRTEDCLWYVFAELALKILFEHHKANSPKETAENTEKKAKTQNIKHVQPSS